MPQLKVVQQETGEDGLTVTLGGPVNSDLASRLQFGGCDYSFDASGTVNIVLKLKVPKEQKNAGKQSTSAVSPRNLGGEGENLDAIEGRTGNNQQNAREENVKPSQKKEKVQAVKPDGRRKKGS